MSVLDVERRAESEAVPAARVERLALRLDEIAESIGVSRRTLERERAAGRFPKADLRVGRMPLWSRGTVLEWIERGGAR
ncbi:MAG: hypothetical protein SFX72_13840 [Isosphaeraceae bacterium]|nr:hypothetical protein [Isosphaeraceae bacterium]